MSITTTSSHISRASDGQVRYLKLNILIVRDALKTLRVKWKTLWSAFTRHPWDDTTMAYSYFSLRSCGQQVLFLDRTKFASFGSTFTKNNVKLIESCDTEKWDVTLLVGLLLTSSVAGLLSALEQAALQTLRQERNTLVGHPPTTEYDEAFYNLHSNIIRTALVDLGADNNELSDYLNADYHMIKTADIERMIDDRIAPFMVPVKVTDRRQRLHMWLDEHFPGSRRKALKAVSTAGAETEGSDSVTQSAPNTISTSEPTLQLLVEREGIMLPLMVGEEQTLVVGSRKRIDEAFAVGTIEPEILNERWILALDDSNLATEQCIIRYNKDSRQWRVEVPPMGSDTEPNLTPVCVVSSGDKSTKVEVAPGSSTQLFVNCIVRLGKQKLSVVSMLVAETSINQQQNTTERNKDAARGSTTTVPRTLKMAESYVPHGRVCGSQEKYDVLDRHATTSSGAFGSIYKVRGCRRGEIYALKCPKSVSRQHIAAAEKELMTLLQLGFCNRHTVYLVDFFVAGGIPHIVLPYAEQGALSDWIPSKGHTDSLPCKFVKDHVSGEVLKPHVQLCRLVDVLIQAADALAYAHDKGITHADIKPHNILVTRVDHVFGCSCLHIMICDFGISGYTEATTPTEFGSEFIESRTAGLGTRRYRAPEQDSPGGNVGPHTDVYSLCQVALELLMVSTLPDVGAYCAYPEIRLWLLNTGCNAVGLVDYVLHRCLDESPSKRLTADQLANGLVKFCNENALPDLDKLNMFDIVASRRDQSQHHREKVEASENVSMLKSRWMSTWYAEFRNDFDAAEQIHLDRIANHPTGHNLQVALSDYAVFLETERNDIPKAVEMYERALALDNNNVELLVNFSDLCGKEGGISSIRTEKLLKQALCLDPCHAVGLTSMAMLLEQRGEYVAAEQHYLTAIQTDPNSPVRLYNYAHFLELCRKDYTKAELFYRKAIDIQPDHTMSLYNLADLLVEIGDFAAAEEMFRRVLAVSTDHGDAIGGLAHVCMSQHRDDEAEPLLIRLIKLYPNDVTVNFNMGSLFMRKNNYRDAIAQFQTVLALEPTHTLAKMKMTEAQQALSGTPAPPVTPVAFVNNAFLMSAGAKKDEGNRYLRDGHVGIALVKYNDALKSLQPIVKSSEAAPLLLALYLNMAHCYLSMRDWNKVIDCCDKATAVDSKNPKAYFRRAKAYVGIGNFQRALLDAQLSEKYTTNANDLSVVSALKRDILSKLDS